MFSISIEDQFVYPCAVHFGLRIQGPEAGFPMLVGCSFRSIGTQQSLPRTFDRPGKFLLSSGLAIWPTNDLEDFCDDSFMADPGAGQGGRMLRRYQGEVIFALWGDRRFERQVANTGWVKFHGLRLPSGHGGYEAKYTDDEIRRKYGQREKVLSGSLR